MAVCITGAVQAAEYLRIAAGGWIWRLPRSRAARRGQELLQRGRQSEAACDAEQRTGWICLGL